MKINSKLVIIFLYQFYWIVSQILEKINIWQHLLFFVLELSIYNNQSGFRPHDSWIHRLRVITHNIFTDFDAYPSLEIRGSFLDLPQVFDELWHKKS